MALTRARRRIAGFFAEAPIFFFAVVLGIALTFRVAIGWAKAPIADDEAKDPTVAKTGPVASATSIPVVTAEVPPKATVPTTVRKKPRPRR